MNKTTPPFALNVIALLLVPFLALAFFLPYAVIWGSASLQAVFDRLLSPFLLLLAISIPVHELLHGIAYVQIGGAPWRDRSIFGNKRAKE